MKVLNFEDSVYKANAIRKVLNQCGVAKIELVSNVEDGLQMLKNAEDTGDPFDLIITDMHYILSDHGLFLIRLRSCSQLL